MTTGLQQQTSQKQVLAPQLRQGVRLLTMSLPELRSELLAEMAKNPVIDDVEPTLEKTTVSDQIARGEEDDERKPDYPEEGTSFDDAFMDGISRGEAGYDADAQLRRDRFFENQTADESLEAHLQAQLAFADIDAADVQLAEILIGELNGDGYFVGSMPDIVMVSGETEQKIREILAKIRELDPPGCGATTLRECLAAQVDAIPDVRLRKRVLALLENLEDVAAGKVVDAEALAALRTLDPRPGRAYARHAEFIVPEVHLERCSDGWLARVGARSIPEIKIRPQYELMAADSNVAPETREYIQERLAAAKSLVQSVERRRDTIEQIAQEIFDRQPGFFEKGLKGLRPMTMQEIADSLGIHEATVSRTVNGKYVSTPRGVVELRRFFARGIKTDSGETITTDGVLARLRAIVDAEDKTSPLSDEKLSALLKAEGFPVARRTVAKYRGLAGIPGTAERRKG